jgi:HEAT repeat protein
VLSLKAFLEQRLDLSTEQLRRLAPFFVLAITLRVADLAADTLATSLFLSHAGVAYLPLAYIFLGVSSVPFYLVFSRLADAGNHIRLMGYLLIGSIVLALGLWAMLTTGSLVTYYAIYIFGGYLWEGMVIDVLFPTLVADYFTVLEQSRYAWLLAIAMAVGSTLGGGLIGLLATRFSAGTLLLGLPILYALAGLLVFKISRSIAPLGDEAFADDDEVSWIAALKTLPSRLQRYPMVALLIGSTLLQVVISTIAEFQYLNIYASAFTNEQTLTQFISGLTVVFSLLEIGVLYFVTRPLLRFLGIPRMNLLYPITTLLSFVGLAFNGGLAGAVAVEFNTVTLDTSLDEPVYTLNYNALPHHVVGEVRSLSDGLFYSVGMAAAGGLLWLLQYRLNASQILAISLGLSVLLIGLHYRLGQSYLRSLQALLHSRLGPIKDRFASRTAPLSRWRSHYDTSTLSQRAVRTLLRHTPATNRQQMLHLALYLAKPGDRRLASLALLELENVDESIVILALQLLSKTRIRHMLPYIAAQLEHGQPAVRAAAAVAMASYGQSSLALAKDYLMSQRPEVVEAAIAAIAQVKTRRAANLLYRYLKPEYEFFTQKLVNTHQQAANALVLKHPTLSRDYWRFVSRVLLILSILEGEDDLRPIFQSLKDSDVRVRAHALEMLLSLRHRRFVLPIFSLLEDAIHFSPLDQVKSES